MQVTVLNGYHGGENFVGVRDWSVNSQKKPLDKFETLFEAKTTYLDRVNFNIADLPQDRVGYINIKLEHNRKVIYMGNKSLMTVNPNEWFSVHLGIFLKEGDQYKLQVTSNGTTSLPNIYLSDDGITPVFTYTYKNNLKIIDKFLVILYYFALYMVCASLILKYKNILVWMKQLFVNSGISKWTVGPYAVLNTFVSATVLYDLKEAVPNTPFFYCLEIGILISGLWFENNFQKVKKDCLCCNKTRIVYILLSLYTSFSIVGNRYFIYPLNMDISLTNIFRFVCLSGTVLPFVVFLTYLLGYGRQISDNVQRQANMPWRVYFLCFGILMFVAVYYIRAFNPAISSPDTLACLYPAFNSIYGINDFHPPFYILWLKSIVCLWNSVYAVLLVQYIWFALVFFEGMRFLYRRGISSGFIILITVLMSFNCSNMVLLTTIWKDIPYSISLLWITIIMSKLIFEYKIHTWLIYLELIIALVCTALMRQNGMVVFIVLIPVLLYSFRRNWKIWVSCLSSVMIVSIVFFPLYTYLGIHENKDGRKFIGLGQDILAAYYNGGNLNEEAMNIVNVLANNNIAEFVYNPNYAANSSFNLQVPVKEFISAYISTFVRNPILMTREIINRQDGVWNILPGQDNGIVLVNYTATMDSDAKWNSIVQKRDKNFLTERLFAYTSRSVNSPLLNMLEWRIGIWTFFSVLTFVVCVLFKKNRKLWILYSVQLGHILSLILAFGWCDYRYYWPLVLIAVFLIVLTLTINKQEKNYIQ